LAESLLKKKLRCSYKKTRLIPGKAQDVVVQKNFISLMESLYDCAKRNDKEVLLYADPMHQVHNVETDYAWQEIGRAGTREISSNTGRRRLNIIGAINPITMQPTILLEEENCNADSIVRLLKAIKNQYNQAETICLILDNARYQKGIVAQSMAKELGIDLVYLPPYSPNLNLIERLWKFFKKKVMKNKYYEDFKTFKRAIECFFENFKQYENQLITLLNFKFGIIKAN
jgi:transposase